MKTLVTLVLVLSLFGCKVYDRDVKVAGTLKIVGKNILITTESKNGATSVENSIFTNNLGRTDSQYLASYVGKLCVFDLTVTGNFHEIVIKVRDVECTDTKVEENRNEQTTKG